ncbi:hypothetical protein THAOC_34722 [Thalassiosira oceanica]|uniref:Uncharacterized protein n=1 Tax=Thalassiosira oceanica TaxID=159749 RepID=K0R302_THAOC|nr:hypothetical protein THAOC_34722 [Thalassiosira oceanica]|eukprot:EJK46600.1 hypothetical protein THAOC_34722 [Thalassiosira oceanica]
MSVSQIKVKEREGIMYLLFSLTGDMRAVFDYYTVGLSRIELRGRGGLAERLGVNLLDLSALASTYLLRTKSTLPTVVYTASPTVLVVDSGHSRLF